MVKVPGCADVKVCSGRVDINDPEDSMFGITIETKEDFDDLMAQLHVAGNIAFSDSAVAEN